MTKRSSSLRYRANGSAYTPGASPVRCERCNIPFMAGYVPGSGEPICTECADALTAAEDVPGLFDLAYVRPSKRNLGGQMPP